MPPKNSFIKTGDFFFKWRNYIVPFLLVFLIATCQPPASYWGKEWLKDVKDVFALYLVLAGLSFRLATIGWAYIKRGGMGKKVYADKLVTEGFFGLCRNPLYVGNMLIYGGIFLVHGHPIVILFGTGFFLLMYSAIIAAEEYYLKENYGQEYAAYCTRVSRWVPSFSQFDEATENMRYSFQRALFKDVMTIFNAFFAMGIIEIVEHYLHSSPEMFWFVARLISSFLIFMLAGVFFIRSLKKSAQKNGLRE